MSFLDRLAAVFAAPTPVAAPTVDANPLAAAQLQNSLRNLAADPSRQNFWAGRRTYSDLEAEYLGRNGLARRCLSMRAFDATRAGWSRRFPGVEAEESTRLTKALAAEERRLDVAAKLRLALTRMEQYGHSIVVMGVDDGIEDLSLPLDPAKATRVLWLKVFARPQYTIGDLSPPTSENFGFPEWYTVNDLCEPEVEAFKFGQTRSAPSKKIHYSRILGPFSTEDGHSRLDEIGQALEDYLSTQTAGSQIVDTFSVGIFKIKNWLGKLSQNADAAKGRISLIQAAKSLVNAIVLDASDEDFNYSTRSAAGLPDLINTKAALLPAFTGIPPMLLLGADPSGFSTGEEIVNAYLATVQALQTDALEEPLRRLTIVLLSTMGVTDPGDFAIVFNPLRTPDPKAVADLRASIWSAARLLVEADLITRDEFRALLADPSDPLPSIQLTSEGSAQEAKSLAVGQVQALQALLLAAYPQGAPADVYRAAVEGALPPLATLAPRLFPEPAAPVDAAEGDDFVETAERWVTADEIAAEFGTITRGQLKRKRASAPKTVEPGRLTWTKPGRDPLYRLSEVRALFDLAGPDLESGTADDPPGYDPGHEDDPSQAP